MCMLVTGSGIFLYTAVAYDKAGSLLKQFLHRPFLSLRDVHQLLDFVVIELTRKNKLFGSNRIDSTITSLV